MTGPHMVAAIGLSSIMALAAIISTASDAMNNSLLAQEAMKIQTQKHQENLEVRIQDGILYVKNSGLKPAVLKEIRIFSDENRGLLSKKEFGILGMGMDALSKSTYFPHDLELEDFDSKTVVAITELGNTFSSMNIKTASSNEGSQNPPSMITGLGVNSRIVQEEHQGKLFYGYGVAGIQSSLRPYNPVGANTDFVAQILDGDPKITIPIPRFNAEYGYIQEPQTLQQVDAANPNILSYTDSRVEGGSGAVSQGPSGIFFSGIGTIILKLNDYGGQTLALEGTVPAGSELSLVEFDRNDLMSIPYNPSYGWIVWTGSYGSIHPGHMHSGCGSPFSVSHTMSLQPRKEVSPSYSVKRVNDNSYHSPSFTTSSSEGQTRIEAVSETTSVGYCNWGMMCGDPTCVWGWTEYNFPNTSPPHTPIPGSIIDFDQKPVNTQHIAFSSSYQITHTFPNQKQLFLVAKPNGNSFSIKGTLFDPLSNPYLKIVNLPQNIPYEITKDGLTSAAGMASSDGTLSLYLDEVKISGSHPSGTITLYPDSMRYRGDFSAIVFDNANYNVMQTTSSDDLAYVAHAFVQIPVVGNVTVTRLSLDDALPLPHLDGNYTTGDKIKIPVIPGYRKISMEINKTLAYIDVADVLGGTGLKVIESSKSTVTKHDDGGLVSSISATAGTMAYFVATGGDKITTSITATISGTAEIENRANFISPPPVPPPPPPLDPLRAYVDVYRNGKFLSKQEIYFNANPQTSNSGFVGGSSSVVSAKYAYPQTVINGVLTTPVEPGDMIEMYLHGNLYSEGPIPPLPSGHTLLNYAGDGKATVTIHSGTILSS